MRGFTAMLAFAACLVGVAARAQGQGNVEGALSLEWRAPNGCPARERVLSDVARMARIPVAPARKIVARGTISEKRANDGASVFVLDLDVDGGTRRLEGPRCESVSDAAAFILALAIDPNAQPLSSVAGTAPPATAPAAAEPAKPPSESPGSETKPVEPPPPAPRAAEPRSTSRVERARDPLAHLSVQGALDLGAMPKASAGPAISAGVRLAPVRVEATGMLHFEQSTSLPIPGVAIGANVTGWTAGARAALPLRFGVVELGPQVGVVAHVLHAEAYGAVRSADGTAMWAGLVVGGLGAVRVHENLAIRLDVAGDIALARPDFVIDEAGSVHRPQALSACAAIGPELRFF